MHRGFIQLKLDMPRKAHYALQKSATKRSKTFVSSKQKRKANGSNKLTIVKILKALHPKLENVWLRNGVIASQLNSRILYCLPATWDRAINTAAVAMMNSSATGVENNWMTGMPSQNTTGQSMVVSNVKQSITLRNVSNHPCKIKIFHCESREDIRNRETEDTSAPIIGSCQIMAANMLFRGWKERLATAEATDTNTGTLVQYTNNLPYIETLGDLSPYQSTPFTKAFKIIGSVTRMMDPGDYVHLKQGCKQLEIPLSDLEPKSNTGSTVFTQERLHLWKGRTKFYMIELIGMLGKATTDDAVTANMTTDVAWEMKQTWKHAPKFAAIPSIASRLDDRTTIGALVFEGPSSRTMQPGDQ